MPYRAESLPAGTVTFLSGHRRELGDRLGFARALEGVAAATGAIGNSLRAARILGAAQRLREEIGTPLSPADLPRYDQCVAAARAPIADGASFDRAWQERRALTLKDAIELASVPSFPSLTRQRQGNSP